MEAEVIHADGRSLSGQPVPVHGGAAVTLRSARLGLIAERDASSAALLGRLLRIGLLRLAEQHADGEFVFTVNGTPAPGGGWRLEPAGTSLRYGAITALGLLRAPEPEQRQFWTEPLKDETGEAMEDYGRHARNFLDCVKSRAKCNCDIETGHRSTSATLLANIALKTRSLLDWDADAERFPSAPEANKLLSYKYRAPFVLPP